MSKPATAVIRSASPLPGGLIGQPLPPVRLGCYAGSPVDVRDLEGRLVIYFYPGCVCSPEDGYQSPALDAVQHRAFADRGAEFLAMDCRPIGISSQSVEGQRRAAADTKAGHILLSDHELQLARALGLPTFNVDNADWYRRVTLLLAEGSIAQAFSALGGAAQSAAQAIAWIRAEGI
jgi:peroxiredoxin